MSSAAATDRFARRSLRTQLIAARQAGHDPHQAVSHGIPRRSRRCCGERQSTCRQTAAPVLAAVS